MLCQVRDDSSGCNLSIFRMIVFFIFTPISLSVFAKPGPVLVQSSDAELHCEITGSPDTEVQWLRPSGQKYNMKKQVIHLKSVTSNEAGQWMCLVTNDGLKVSVTLTVVGWCPSVVFIVFFFNYYNISHFMLSVTFVWFSNRSSDHSC